MKTSTSKAISAEAIPHKMLSLDPFSTWLGVEIVAVKKGYCKLKLKLKPTMLNSMQKAHGAITYALADTAFGFAANSHGNYAVSIETSINHIEALEEGDVIFAETSIDITKNKLGFHIVEIKKDNQLVALFKGVVYRTSKQWHD